MGRDFAIAVGLVIITLGVYFAVLPNEFVSFDDPLYITNNPHVQAGLSWEGFVQAFSRFHSDNWHPLTWISHMVDVTIFGLDPRGHHAVSALLHALNAALLFSWLRMVRWERIPSAAAAALFALHPQRVESVAWAAERKDVLSGLFFLLTLIAYTQYARAMQTRATHDPDGEALRSSHQWGVIVLLGFALGLLAKPMLVTLPIVLLLLDFWPLGRLGSIAEGRARVVEKWPLFVLAGCSSVLTVAAQASGRHTMQSLDAIPWIARLSNAALSPFAYLRDAIWPTKLAFFHPHPALVDTGLPLSLPLAGALAAFGLIVSTWLAWRSARSQPQILVGWGWFLVMLLPVIGIVQVGIQARADRYTYLPMIGITIALCGSVRALAREGRSWLWVPIGAAIATATWLTLLQIATWQDDFSLYRHAIRVTRNNYVAEHNLGASLAENGRLREAATHYERALAIRPDYAASHSNLGLLYERVGEPEAALAHYRAALEIDPHLSQAHTNLGTYHAERGDYEAALSHYERAREERPRDVRLLNNIAGILRSLGRSTEAVAILEQAIEIEPRSAELHTKLAGALREQGQDARARHELETALLIEPGLLPTSHQLAKLLATSDDPAVRDLEAALRHAQFCASATRHLNRVFLVTLAMVHAEAGEFDRAIEWQERAVELTPASERAPQEATLARYRALRAERSSPATETGKP